MTKISFEFTAEKPWGVISRASKFGVIEKIISIDTIYSGIHYTSVSTQKFYTVGILVSKKTVLANKSCLFYSLKKCIVKYHCSIDIGNRNWKWKNHPVSTYSEKKMTFSPPLNHISEQVSTFINCLVIELLRRITLYNLPLNPFSEITNSCRKIREAITTYWI